MITFEIQDNTQPSGWFDIVPYWAFDTLKEDENDVDGPNTGRSMSGLLIRDKIGEKEKYFFESIPMSIETSWAIKALARQEYIVVRTNLKDGTLQTFNMYCGARSMKYMLNRKDGSQLVKLSFNMIER